MSYKNNKIWGIVALALVLALIFSTVAEAVVLRSSRIGSFSSKSSVSKTNKFKSSALNQIVQNSKIKKSTVLKSSVSSGSNFKPSKASKLKQASKKSSGSSSPSGKGDQASVMTSSKYEQLKQRMQNGQKRIILQDSYSESEIANLENEMGCSEPIHKFDDFISVVCPAESVSKLKNVIDDSPTYHELSLQSNIQIKADLVQAANYDGSGVTVAIIDNGVDRNNPEIADSIVDVVPFGFTNTEDETGHGTEV